ncbi:MAG TPA: pyridoxamine 5'-phosphate oxidase, partial [Burkholderiaceae bacterium]|nr:pyridoxamine 5'-phosphate oxidase [Burkholderiaceae bacterium]
MDAPRLATLADVEAAVWRELERAASTKGHAWRQCVLATVDDERADARTVVLREASTAERTL